MNGNSIAIKELLKLGADPNIGKPLITIINSYSIYSGDKIELCKLLFNAKANLPTNISSGSTPLHLVISQNNLELVSLIMEQKKIDLEAKDSAGETPLQLAAKSGYLNIVKLLVDKRVNISQAFEVAKNDAIRANLLFIIPITPDNVDQLKKEIESLKKYNCTSFDFDKMMGVFEMKISPEEKYYKVIDSLRSMLSTNINTSSSRKDTFFQTSSLNSREINFYGLINSFLQQIEKYCRMPLRLPESFPKTAEVRVVGIEQKRKF